MPDVHFYAVSATALVCAALAVVLGTVGVRRHDRRAAAIGAGFTVIASLLAVHGLTTPGFLVEGEYASATGVSGALAVPLGGAVILAALLSRPRELGYVRDLVLLQIGVVATVLAFGSLALLDPEAIPDIPVALSPLVWWIVAAQRADLRTAGAARAAHLPAHPPHRRPRRRRRTRVARDRRRHVPAEPALVGRLLGRARARAGRLRRRHGRARERPRPRHAVARTALGDRRARRRDRAGGAARAPGWRACSRGSRSRTPRRASTPGAWRSSPSQVGQELGLRGARLRGLAVAALLHDVGKLQVPDEILRKAGPLSAAEFALIKRHPGDGAALLTHIGGFAEEAPLVRGHHERLDGSGYPDGLRGEELSLEVRILGACDVYDALDERARLPPLHLAAQALAILEQGRGHLFDPDVLDALERVVGAAAPVTYLAAAACARTPRPAPPAPAGAPAPRGSPPRRSRCRRRR